MLKKYFAANIFIAIAFVAAGGVSIAYAADELTVASVTAGTHNLIGAVGAQWKFTATTTNAISPGQVIQFILPTVNQAIPFTTASPTIVATSSDMVGVFNLYPGTSTPDVGLLSVQSGGSTVIYGYATTTIPGGTAFSVTIGGMTNASGQLSTLSALTWTVRAGTPQSSAQPGGTLSPSQYSVASTSVAMGLIRGGASLVSDINSSLAQSSYVTGASATTTIRVTLATDLPAGSKIGINFPTEFDLTNAAIPNDQTISTSSAAVIAAGAIAVVNSAGANRVVLTTSAATVLAGNAITVSVGGLTNPTNAGVYRPFSIFTMRSNSGLLDGSFFGFENSDFSNGAPPPMDTLHIGGKNTLAVQVLKKTGTATSTLSAAELAQVKVGVGCPDKQFFMGERWLDANGVAQYNNTLDCNYMVGVNPFNKGAQSFYDTFLPPGMKTINLVAGSTGQAATSTLIFSVPTATTTFKITGGVSGATAFIRAFSADNESFSSVFTDTTYTTVGFDGSGNGYAKVKMDIGKNWNFSLQGGSFGSQSNFSDNTGAKRWPPTIPSVNIAATTTSNPTLNIGTFAYVTADKNLVVTLAKTGGGAVSDACVGVSRSGGGIFTPPQDMICQPNYNDSGGAANTYRFKVPAGAITVQINRPGFGAPKEFPVAVSSSAATTTMPTVTLDSPTSYITVSVRSSANGTTTPISGAPVSARGSNGQSNGMTNSSGLATLYLSAGTYTVEGFAPAFGPLTAQSATVTSVSNPSVSFTVNSGNLRTISGRVTQSGSGGVAGISIGARGTGATTGGNGAQTDSNGDYSIYVPAGTYEVNGWSPNTGGLSPLTADVTAASVSGKNWAIGATGTLHLEIQNASSLDTLFAGAFDATTGKGNGTNSWTASSTSKVADIPLPAGTYEVHAGSPSFGEIGSQSSVVITAGDTTTVKFNVQSSVTLVTLSGSVTASSVGVEGVNVWASRVNGPGFFSTVTDSSGNYSMKVPDALTYRMGVRSLAYIAAQGDIDKAVSGNTSQNFTLSAAGSTITGTIKNSSGTAIANAWVSAFKTGVDNPTRTGTPTDAAGSYTLNVDSSSTWSVVAEGPCYLRSSPISASAGDSSKDITLSADAACTAPVADITAITDTSGGQISKSDMTLNIPANALGTSQGSVSVSVSDAATVVSSANATPLRGSVKSITATDSTGQSITSLNNSASLVITYDPAELPNGFNESNIQLGYFDTTTGQWEPVAATVDETNNTLTASVSHFTDYGPILPGVPDAPTGLSASAASASSITLSWTASPSATTYTIYRSTTDSNFTTELASGVTGTSYTSTGLSASTAYYYEVAGVNANGEGSNSTSANATTNAAAVASMVYPGGGGGGGISMISPYLASATSTVAAVSAANKAFGSQFSRSLVLGRSGSDVSALQAFLVERGYLKIPTGIPRGYFGSLTKQALVAFQRDNKIDTNGVFGPATRAALLRLVDVKPNSAAASMVAAPGRSMVVGMSGDDVVGLQTFLIEKGYLVIPIGVPKGTFGSLTKRAVIDFQKEMGIDPIGVAGPATQKMMRALKK